MANTSSAPDWGHTFSFFCSRMSYMAPISCPAIMLNRLNIPNFVLQAFVMSQIKLRAGGNKLWLNKSSQGAGDAKACGPMRFMELWGFGLWSYGACIAQTAQTAKGAWEVGLHEKCAVWSTTTTLVIGYARTEGWGTHMLSHLMMFKLHSGYIL